MKAAYLVKYGEPTTAFEIREIKKPDPGPEQVLIKVEAFGLNFADVMARLGLYRGAPPLPALLGYDVVGHIEKCGSAVRNFKEGDRVTALTRFGGYAEYAVTEEKAVGKIPKDMPAGVAAALATQGCTAYFNAYEMANLQEGDHVLIHAAAGGVGTALVQLALHRKCIVFGTCGSAEKIEYLKKNGVHHPINHRKEDFTEVVRSVVGSAGLDVVFNPVGGKSARQGFKLLGAGGRIICYGVSSMNQTSSIFGKLKVMAQFGLYHPVQFLMQSKGMIGVNMLQIANERPEKIARVMKRVIEMEKEGILQPFAGGSYPIEKLAAAHQYLESRKSMGKIVVSW